ncbi:MAG TPA: inositol-3-phosphate synthase [Methanosarcinales archaeon]|nr:inositol-3-phosphate synthase [Methanosarcinales archaeon]
MSIKVAITGVGNCASSLVQGVEYYKEVDENSEFVPGLMHNVIGGYRIHDIEFVAAFDIDKRKVGNDLSKAIFSEPNNTLKFSEVPELDVEVQKGPVIDGINKYTEKVFLVDENQENVNIAQILKETGADILINYLPVGSEESTKFYANQALEAGVGFINAIPVFIASNKEWASKFKEKGLPVIGDDVKSQVGATIVHRTLSKLFSDRGVIVDHTYQLNVGGNADFLNMLDRDRLKSKKISKTQSVQSQFPTPLKSGDIYIGPSDHVPWLKDKKIAFIRIEGRKFGDVPIIIDARLEVIDSPNSAGVMIDAIRLMKLALDRGIGGPLESASAYLMKSPPKQFPDPVARDMIEEFIIGDRFT